VLKKGDKVVMHTCVEAEVYDGIIWTVASDVYERRGREVVELEDFFGAFSVEYLQKVNIEQLQQELKQAQEKADFYENTLKEIVEYEETLNPNQEPPMRVLFLIEKAKQALKKMGII
jgi:formyltetrahydrofolate hydrolase